MTQCKGCFKEIVEPFSEFGGQAFHDFQCMAKWARRVKDRMLAGCEQNVDKV